jgi:2-phospho-L-lactate guanylyltransferase
LRERWRKLVRIRRADLKRRLWVVLPMRGLARGKSRLAPALDQAGRARLNQRMLRHTLAAIAGWLGGLQRCIVVSGCARTLRSAKCAGARSLREPRPARGLDSALRFAAAWAIRCGARGVMVLPSDLPLVTAAALDALLDRSVRGYAGAIAPNAARTGTNALLLKTRARFTFAYGPDSYRRHLREACSRGLSLAVVSHPQLALDVDLPDDLATLRSAGERPRCGMV